LIADTVRSHPRPGSNSNGNLAVAAPLTSGSHPNSNAPGRRKEDDENLVIAGPLGGGNDGIIGRRSEDDPNLVAYPISGDALRGEGTAITPSPDAEGRIRLRDPGFAIGNDGEPAFTLSSTSPGAVGACASVRRLTPTECERLQAFPDGWTDLGGTPDSRRYAALGDAVTINVAEWIGRRILATMP
jgi:site-specific DNA-cytosine methylase